MVRFMRVHGSRMIPPGRLVCCAYESSSGITVGLVGMHLAKHWVNSRRSSRIISSVRPTGISLSAPNEIEPQRVLRLVRCDIICMKFEDGWDGEEVVILY